MQDYIDKAFYELKDIKLRNDRDYIAGRIDEVLKEQENKSFELTIGYYDRDGFNGEHLLNGDSHFALMDINGDTIIQEVINMFETIDFTAVTGVKIYFDEPNPEYGGWDYSLVEYNGYELFTDL